MYTYPKTYDVTVVGAGHAEIIPETVYPIFVRNR